MLAMGKGNSRFEEAFEKAIAARDLDAVEDLMPLLIKKKPKLLFQAIENADVDLVRSLLDRGVALEERHYGGTPLLTAVFELTEIETLKEFESKKDNLLKIVHLLVEKGADINARTPDGVSILRLASTLRDPLVSEYLRSGGAQL